jgi:zinc protease
MLGDNPNNTAVNESLKNLFQIQTKSQDIIGGTVENIENLTRDKVVDYYNNFYTPDNMTTVVVGEVDPNSTAGLINRYFGQNQPAKANKSYSEELRPIQNSVRKDFKNANIESTLLNMGFAGPVNSNSKEVMATSALCTALTGYKNARLNIALRPFNAIASVGMETISPKSNDPSAILLDANFKPGSEEEGLKTVYSTLHNMTSKPLDESEMTIVKNKLKESLKYSSESAMSISSFIGHSMLDHGDIRQYSSSIKEIDNLTSYDIMQAAQKFLNLNKTAITMLHPDKGAVSNNVQNAKAVSFCGKKPENFEVKEHLRTISMYTHTM